MRRDISMSKMSPAQKDRTQRSYRVDLIEAETRMVFARAGKWARGQKDK